MKYRVSIFGSNGRHSILGEFGNIASARQAMLDHSNIYHLPIEPPFHCPEIGIIEGWFVGRTEYNIEAVT